MQVASSDSSGSGRCTSTHTFDCFNGSSRSNVLTRCWVSNGLKTNLNTGVYRQEIGALERAQLCLYMYVCVESVSV